MRITPQCQKVVDHIKRWGSLNSIEAIRHYGITRLAARIHDLSKSQYAMKGVSCITLAPGFVKYVPDFEKRRANLREQQMAELANAPSKQIAEINIKYASKFAVVNTQEREYMEAA